MSTAIELTKEYVNETYQHCKLLFDSVDFSYFSHMRYYLDSKVIGMVSDAALIDIVIDNKFYLRRQDLEEFAQFNILRKHTSKRNKVLCETLNIDHMLLYYSRHSDHYEMNAFGTIKSVNEMVEFYLNNIALIKLFVQYFKDKSKNMVDKLSDNPYIFEEFNQGFVFEHARIPCTDELVTKIEAERLIENYKLSPREMQCMKLLSQGKSTKEIARDLELSPNTVQFYINNLKDKVNCRKVAEVIKLYYETTQPS